MFDVRLRLATPAGGKGRVLKTLTLDVTQAGSATPQVRFTTSSRVAGFLEAPFIVGVEYTTGGAWVAPRDNLFIAFEDSGDTADLTGAVSFVAHGYVPWLSTRNLLQWASTAKDGERSWTNASAGGFLTTFVSEGKARGWGPSVTTDFSATLDSNGAAWTADDKITQAYRLDTPMSQVLDSLSKQGMCEWWTEGMLLRLVRAGTGSDKTNVRLGGPGFTRTPLKSSFADVFTHLNVQSDKFAQVLSLANAGADTQFGRLEASMTVSGIADPAAATRLAQPALTGGRAVKREQSYDWTAAGQTPRPWADFNIGDLVTVRDRASWSQQRVVGIVVSKGADGVVTVRAVTGSKLQTLNAKLIERSGAAMVGTIIGGSGDGVPASPGAPSLTPAAPGGLHVDANTAVWGDDGTAVASVTLAWDQVIAATDGSALDVDVYELWAREAADLSSSLTATDELATTVTVWRPDVPVWVKVRARSVRGVWSGFSPEISVTPASPLSITPKAPTGLAVTANTGTFQPDGSVAATLRVQWNAVTQSTADMPVTIDAYELWALEGAVWAPVRSTPARDVLVGAPGGAARSFRVRALTSLGVWSDFSSTVAVTAAVPAQVTTAPTVPVLASGGGLVFPSWDGNLTSGPVPAGFQHLLTEQAASSGGPWTAAGVPTARAGQTATIRGTVGSTVWVSFRWVDTLGRVSNRSTAVSITVSGVALPDLDGTVSSAIAAAQADADAAQATADGKNTVWYQTTAPAGTGHRVGDVWFDTDDGHRMYRWSGSAWTATQFGASAVADSAITNAKIASGAVVAAKLANGAVDATKLASAVNTAISAAQSAAAAAQSTANTAVTNAATAQTAAGAAQTSADSAASAAASAAGIANGKGKVLVQSGTPAAGDQLAQNLWIDTTGGANTPKRWSGSAWVAVTDKVATDAASAAAAAQSTASTAQSNAAAAAAVASAAQTAAAGAQTAADAAQAAATAAQTTASGKNAVTYSTAVPSGSGSRIGDLWFRLSGDLVIGMWTWTGSAWQSRTIDSATIANLDAGKITTGFLNAARIQAGSLAGSVITAGTLTAAALTAGTITAASGVIADATIGTAKLIDAAVTTAKIGDAQITNAKIVDATIQSAKIAALDAGKITTGSLDAARIAAGSISTAKLLVTSLGNYVLDPGFEYNTTQAWTLGGGAANGTTNPRTGARALALPTAAAAYIGATQGAAFAVEPGDKLRVTFWVRTASGVSANNGVSVRFKYGSAEAGPWTDGANTYTPNGTGTTYTQIVGEYTVPAGASWVRPEIVCWDTAAGKTYYVDDVAIYKKASAELIVDGTITTANLNAAEIWANEAWLDVLRAGVIETSMVTAGFAQDLELTANGAITSIIETQTAQAAGIAAAQSDASTAATVAGDAATTAAGAQAAADAAQAAAVEVGVAHQATAEALATVQTWFRVDADGAHVGRSDSAFQTHVEPDRFSITESGTVTTYWESGRMVVPSLVSDEVVLSNHKLEKYGDGTVVRAVGV